MTFAPKFSLRRKEKKSTDRKRGIFNTFYVRRIKVISLS